MIVIHELGHFVAAKKVGINVEEFAVGMGPAIFKKEKDGTTYSLRLVPFGGFCEMEGEDEDEAHPSTTSFNSKSVGKRLIVIVMGSAMNLLLGFVILFGLTVGEDRLPTLTVDTFKEESAWTEAAGLKSGDELLKINGSGIFTIEDLQYYLAIKGGEEADLLVRRDGEKVLLSGVTFPYREVEREEISGDYRDEGKIQKIYYLDFYVEGQDAGVLPLLHYSFFKGVTIVKVVWMSLIELVSGNVGMTDIRGPVGVTGAIGTAAQTGISSLLGLVALISINLGVINLLPIPALDGGRLVFLIFEGITKRRVPQKVEGAMHYAGFVLLIGLSIFIAFNDVIRIIFQN